MFNPKKAFSGFSVKDLAAAQKFYSETLGLKVEDNKGMGLIIHLPASDDVFIYEKKNHEPATYTMLNFEVDNLEAAIDDLAKKGVKFEQYDLGDFKTDEKGIMHGIAAKMGPDIAWFKDPAGNILGVLQNA